MPRRYSAQFESMMCRPMRKDVFDVTGSYSVPQKDQHRFERPLPVRAYWFVCFASKATHEVYVRRFARLRGKINGHSLRNIGRIYTQEGAVDLHDVALKERARWLGSFWRSLTVFNSVERRADGTAQFLSYRIAIETPDRTDRESILLAQFVVTSEARGLAHFGFQITNARPKYAAKMLSGYLLGVADEDLPGFSEGELRG